ncbi:MAG: chromosome segregation protein SMC [bacterium]
MYLKQLDMFGFKSFADKIEIQLEPGVTAIVGPNGSGKSNIADAIQWVLGEQSAKTLRGARMEDIIFTGSVSRRQLGLAEVSLTLDNSDGALPIDYGEVNIMRRLYRSGESEYLLNKTPCRLKDIQDLLADTGLGKDAYSVIGQGKIDEILSVRSEDRRLLLEEAAGITKYKNRKKEALRRLEDTRQNMVRLNDIIAELAGQVGPLAVQAARAEKYTALHSRLEGLEVAALVDGLLAREKEAAAVRGRMQAAEDAIAEKTAAHARCEAAAESRRSDIIGLDTQLGQMVQELHEMDGKIERLAGQAAVARERQNSYAERQKRLAAEKTETEERAATAAENQATSEAALAELQNAVDGREAAAERENAETAAALARLGEKEERLDQLKSDLIDIMNQAAAAQNRQTALAAEAESVRRAQERLAAEADRTAERRRTAAAQAASKRRTASEAEQAAATAALQSKERQKEARRLEAEAARLRTRAAELRNEMNAAAARQRALSEMQATYEGYQKGVRSVLLAVRRGHLENDGICGVLSELLRVPAEYETAVSTALGGAMQNIVTTDTKAAQSAVEYLKRHQGGRATFLPLAVVKPSPVPAKLAAAGQMPGIISFAASLVAAEPAYKPVLDYLLGHVLVAVNLESALAAAAATGHRYRIVTLEGELLSPGGSITGGTYSRQPVNLLARGREIKTLQKKVASLAAEMEKAEAASKAIAAEGAALAAEIGRLEQTKYRMETEKTAAGRELAQFVAETGRLEKETKLLNYEQAAAAERLAEIIAAAEQEKTSAGAAADRASATQKDIASLQAEINADRAVRDELMRRTTENKVNLAKWQQKKENLRERINFHRNERKNLAAAAREITAQLEETTDKINETEMEITVLSREKEAAERQRQAADIKLQKVRQERMTIEAAGQEQEKQIKKLGRALNELRNELHAHDLCRTTLELEIRTGKERLLDDYNLSYEAAKLVREKVGDLGDAAATAAALRNEIAALGPVNPGAVAEYARVRERYEFLRRQYADLDAAQAGLNRVIAEIDAVMEKMFEKAFTAIRAHFREIFAELFEGGKADLRLTDEADFWSAGLEIFAQPPGKKLQNISLLSGGEKALTAISLLLAILRYRPSPFCVLDEIDATLDETNVDRFTAFLKEFARRTQFIVVTHRRGTMEAADVLYGVTMEESGVSKLISVKFMEEAS